MSDLHDAFRGLLERSPFTDTELARAADVSHTTVYRWRTGQSTASFAEVMDIVHYHDKHLNAVHQLLTTCSELARQGVARSTIHA